jgi:uncharacterized protein
VRRLDIARPLRGRLHTLAALGLMLGLVALPSCSAEPAEAVRAEPAPAPVAANTTASAPAPPSRLAEAVRAGRTIQVGVFGDSFADGLWWGLDQEFGDGEVAAMHRFGRPSTGFTNYTQIDLLADIRDKLDRKPVEVAVIVFGANDAQPLHGAAKPTPFMSEDWKRVVGGRLEALVTMLKERGVAILWVGLPKMRAPAYEERIRRLNEFYAQEMRRHGVSYVETVSITTDGNGGYVGNLPGSDGQVRPARSSDGIHMTMSGYRVLAAPLARRIRAMIDEARPAAAQPRS